MAKSNKSDYKFWHSPLALGIILCFLLFFGYKIIFLIEKQRETTHKKEVFLNEINELNKKEAMLSLDISKLETEGGKEEIIRSKYQVTKAGEKMVTIVDEQKKVETILDEKNEGHGLVNWFKKLFNK